MGGDTYRYGNLFSSPPAVGFWAIMAVTGSVALLTLGKKRIWSDHNHQHHHNHHHPRPHHHHASTSTCCCKRKISDSDGNDYDDDGNGVKDDVDNTILTLDCGEILQEKIWDTSPEKPHPVVLESSQQNAHQDDDDKKMPKKVLQSSLAAPRSGKEARRVVSKKVRFAPDVVDPSGDGHEYRSRNQAVHSAHINKVKLRKQEHELLYDTNSLGLHRSKSLDAKAQTVAKPSLPENRMLLYGGMYRYNTLMALHWR